MIDEDALQAAFINAATAIGTGNKTLNTAFTAMANAIKKAPPAPTNIKYSVGGTGPWNIAAAFTLDKTADGADLYCDGTKVDWARGNAPHVAPNLTAGSHVVYMTAYNIAGEGVQSPNITLTVGNVTVPPVVVPPTVPSSKLKGVFTWDAGTVARTKAYETALAVPHFDIMLEHMDMTNWNTLQSLWFASAWKGQGYRMCITFCPFPDDGSTLAQAAAGKFDSQWQNMLTQIATAFPDAILRFAHEQNCCYPWKAVNDPANYIKMWDHWAQMARATSSKFLLVWNPIYGDGNIAAELTYPSNNSNVDIMAMDCYDFAGGMPTKILTGSHGLNWLATFAASKGKPMMLCEWNIGNYPTAPAQNSGDDPAFMQMIYNWVQSNNVFAQIIYNDDNSGLYSVLDGGKFPNSLHTYRTTFGTATS